MIELIITKTLFEEWNNQNIVYCQWKSNEHLYEGLIGDTDLDILCKKEQQELVHDSLLKNKYVWVSSQFGSRYRDVEDWIGFDYETGRLIHIHLHYRMITGHAGLKEYNLPWTDLALETRVFNEKYGVYTIEPNLEMIVLLTRIGIKTTIFTKQKVKQKKFDLDKDNIAEINYLKALVDEEKLKKLISKYYSNDQDKFYDIIITDKFDSIWMSRLMHIVEKHTRKYNRLKIFPLLQRTYYLSVLMIRYELKKILGFRLITKKTFGKGNGISIAIVGQDGAGKSTIVQELTEWLSWKMDVHRYYMGCGDGYNSVVKKLMEKCNRKPLFRGVAPAFGLMNYLNVARLEKRNVKSAQKHVERGCIAIFDRYPQVQYLGISDSPKITTILKNHKNLKLLNSVLKPLEKYEFNAYRKAANYQPTVVIKLLLDPVVSIQRKPEESLENVKEKHEVIKNLSFASSKVIEIDATMDYAEECLLLKRTIWNSIKSNK